LEVEMMEEQRALRWSAVFALMIPFLPAIWGLTLGVRYRRLAARTGEQAAGHRFVPWAQGICVVMLLVHGAAVSAQLFVEY